MTDVALDDPLLDAQAGRVAGLCEVTPPTFAPS
jgi:hypothetical protein